MYMRMDVLLVTADEDVLTPGSAGEDSVKEYASLGKHIVIFVLYTGRRIQKPRRVEETLWIIPVHAPFRFLAALLALRKAKRELYFQRKLQVELIDACDSYESAFAAWLIAGRFGRPLHIYKPLYNAPRYVAYMATKYFYRFLSNFLIRKADTISTDSEHLRAQIAHDIAEKESRVFAVPRFVTMKTEQETPAIDVRSKYPTFKIILLSVGPLERDYNPELAIHILAGVLRSYSFAGLIFVGEGSLRGSLMSLASKLGCKDRVIFEPWDVDLTSYYKAAHIFLGTSPVEEYGNSIAEAAAASSTIVSTKVGFASAFIKDGENGYVCGVHDTACFVNTISSLINHPEVREKVRLNAMLTAENFMGKTERKNHLEIVKKAWEGAVLHYHSTRSSMQTPQIHIYSPHDGTK